ncbi:hypothetical protein DFJ73DRAFT_100096 [Zopfochytrium polystomum]|nr:hypothetical protein DFJ73DRAFT_100096 [Zopfochytrium polystomum]
MAGTQIESLFRTSPATHRPPAATENATTKSVQLSRLLQLVSKRLDSGSQNTDSPNDSSSEEEEDDSPVSKQPPPPPPSAWAATAVRPVPGSWQSSQTKAGISATAASFAAWGRPTAGAPVGRGRAGPPLRSLFAPRPDIPSKETPDPATELRIRDIESRGLSDHGNDELLSSEGPSSSDPWVTRWPPCKTASHLQREAKRRLVARLSAREAGVTAESSERRAPQSSGGKTYTFKTWNKDAILRLPPPPPIKELARLELPWDEDGEDSALETDDQRSTSPGLRGASAGLTISIPGPVRHGSSPLKVLAWSSTDVHQHQPPPWLATLHAAYRPAAVEATTLLYELYALSRLDDTVSRTFDAALEPWISPTGGAGVVVDLLVAALHPPVHPSPGWESALPPSAVTPGPSTPSPTLPSATVGGEGTFFVKPDTLTPQTSTPVPRLPAAVLTALLKSLRLLRHALRVHATSPLSTGSAADAAVQARSESTVVAELWGEEVQYLLANASAATAGLACDGRALAQEVRREVQGLVRMWRRSAAGRDAIAGRVKWRI